MNIFNLSLQKDFRPFPKVAAAGVYAYWDAKGNLLYIGQSGNVNARRKAHARKKWGVAIARERYCPIADASDRLIAETVLVLRHFPRHNRAIRLGLSHASRRVHELQFLKSTTART